MGLIESFIIYGTITGAVYALLALGFTLIYGVADIVNMAHGAFFMLGAYLFHSFTLQLFHLDPYLALILAAVAAGIIGSVIHRIFIEPIAEDTIAVLVVTVGVALILQQLVTIIYGVGHVPVPPFFRGSVIILGVTVTYAKILAFAVSLILFFSLWIFLIKAKVGGAMRAAAQDREVAMLMGINTSRLHMLTMGISASIAAVAGTLIATSTSRMAEPFMWLFPLVMSFSIVILGGLGNVKGTLTGALIVGYAETAVVTFVPEGSYLRGAAALAIMVGVLLLRPRGLFGKRVELED